MIKRLLSISGLVLLFTVPVYGQNDDYPRVEAFGGLSYFNVDAVTRDTFYGWQASVSTNFHKNVGVTADVGGQYKTLFGTSIQGYEFLIGPRFTARGRRFTGFTHALFGFLHARGGGLSDTIFAAGFGGGVDVNGSDRVAIRVVQFDYIPSRFSGEWRHNARLGFGMVIKF
jgi:hypothetical protein